jgi:hypothetical protein
MEGEKIQQMKDAMITILDDLNESDHFNIITFSSEVEIWNPKDIAESESVMLMSTCEKILSTFFWSHI